MKQKQEKVKGYKVTNSEGRSKNNNFLFEVGKTYKHEGEIKLCFAGFHFCINANKCFDYYDFDPKNLVFEIEAVGNIEHGEDGKSVCSGITIIRLLTWPEVLDIANIGRHNTGHSNTGDSNTGDRNTGDRNRGDSNTGDRNRGDSNTGDRNRGDSNTGDRNRGDSNTGDRNRGDSNTGDRNRGDSNTGDRNRGDSNTGYRNTGYSNTGDRNTGAFCTGEDTIKLFDKDSKMTYSEFENSEVFRLLSEVNTKFWIESEAMTEEEKVNYPSHSTCGGYLKDIPYKEVFQHKWGTWTEANRQAFLNLPNFDATIFETITGVKIEG